MNLTRSPFDSFKNNEVNLTISLPGDPSKGGWMWVEASADVTVNFELDIDYRDYGIKGINLRLIGTVPVSLELCKEDESEEKLIELTVDCLRLKAEKQSAYNLVMPTDIYLVLNDALEIDYEKSTYGGEPLPS